MKIFSGTSNKPLAGKIAKFLKKPLGRLEVHIFADEEKRVRVVEKILGEDCVVVQSASINADKNYMELFFIADALKRSGAKSVTAVIPYLGYQRQDHIFRNGEAVSLAVIVKILETVGIDKVITFDLHSIKIPEFFQKEVVHLSGLPLFAEKIKGMLDDVVIVSPDMGGVRRVKILSKMLGGTAFAVIEKNRDLASGKISVQKITGVIKKRAIIVDDMISTGSTIVKAAELLKKKGAEEIYVFATHAVFSSNAPESLGKSPIKKILVTDTIDVPEEKRFGKLEILSVAEMITTALKKNI